MSEQHNARIIDSDEAKKRLEPEYDGGYGANRVQDESAYITEQLVFDGAVARGENIVIPKVGKSAEGILKIAQTLKNNGYIVDLHLNSLPMDKAISRGIGRFIGQGRYVPIEYMQSIGDRPTETYNAIKESGLFDSWEWKSNDVAKGEEPILIERGGVERHQGKDSPKLDEGGRNNLGRRGTGENRQNQSENRGRREHEIESASGNPEALSDIPTSIQKINPPDGKIPYASEEAEIRAEVISELNSVPEVGYVNEEVALRLGEREIKRTSERVSQTPAPTFDDIVTDEMTPLNPDSPDWDEREPVTRVLTQSTKKAEGLKERFDNSVDFWMRKMVDSGNTINLADVGFGSIPLEPRKAVGIVRTSIREILQGLHSNGRSVVREGRAKACKRGNERGTSEILHQKNIQRR